MKCSFLLKFPSQAFSHPSTLTLSVIIPVYNGDITFRHCLSSLKQTKPSPDEIIVVADGDTDGSRLLAKEYGATVLELPESKGPAHARNLGAKVAQGDILFFTDADVMIPPNTFNQVKKSFKNQPEVTAFFGSYDDEPSEKNFLSQYKNLFHHYTHQQAGEEASTFFAACGAIRRDIFLALGGFDEHYHQPCIEDIELGYRLKQAGYKIRLVKTLQVKHLKCWRILSLLKSDFFCRALPWTELILRNGPFINDLNLRLSNRLSVVLTYIFLLALGGIGWWLGSLAIVTGAILLLLWLNAPLYKFFWRKRGLWFAIKAIPWHWFYYFYGGLAFIIGLGRFLFKKVYPFQKG